MEKDLKLHTANESGSFLKSVIVSVLSGGTAASLSRTVTSPLERMKIIFQVQSNKEYNSMFATVAKIWKREGILGFFRGNGTNCLRAFPYGAVQFATYSGLKQLTLQKSDRKDLSNYKRLIFGAISGAASVISTYPLDIARTRLSIQTAGLIKDNMTNGCNAQSLNLMSTLRTIYRNEGGISAFYSGLPATLLNVVPYVSIVFFTYEWCKEYMFSGRDLNSLEKLSLGGFSGFIAQTFAFPADVLRRRFQVNRIPGIGYHYSSISDAIAQIYSKEGLFGFFRGYFSNLLKIIPVMSVTWYTFETVSKVFSNV
ncbi:coenzyme A/diphosphate transporter [Schizosaccharomyces cryophilus OY26]|uniref:Coenzyme A/diphosphate transporter n=1 Tax=Schizosaccharomyces cryophilus (strain OY26 / ATCC MYA-4695 / CBS 11777 / NBRC 106824 / NRRL Y48691) TaxID=653667 RepID=S9VXI2_SCHCR|nr:coenzyme A/diphosphate transporter [Schizosaccharomyces cryophilus OY26]EPY50894.1 coenzyme A/diphosphate transporter [Schizosaccharomyces cryophilus OY26]